MADVPEFSFENVGGAPASPDRLDALNAKIAEAIALKEAVDQMEEDLKATKHSLNHITTVALPDMMSELGMDEVTQRGWKIKVGEFVSGSLPKDPAARDRAIAWLVQHEGGDLVKTELKVGFSRSQHNEALALAHDIEGRGYAPAVDSNVHPQTLAAFARERLKNGEPVDTEILGLYTGRVAKFTAVKEKGSR